MTIAQRLSLMWRRFSPLEEQLLTAVREILPPEAQGAFDAQVAGITLVQRLPPHWTEISFYRLQHGKPNWSGIPTFPRTGEFPLAEVRFRAARRAYKATLTSIGGHIFDFAVRPSPKAVAFAAWDSAATARLLSDPLAVESRRAPEPIPAAWREFLARHRRPPADDWTFHDADTAYRITLDEGEFLILAERAGDEFILHRVEPAASGLFYVRSHDAAPRPLEGLIDDFFRKGERRKT